MRCLVENKLVILRKLEEYTHMVAKILACEASRGPE